MKWSILHDEALDEFNAGTFNPVHVRQPGGGLVVIGDPHEWRRARFTGAFTCARCGLMPFDYDRYEVECSTEGGE